jgi:SAM-dependent methyltransferase
VLAVLGSVAALAWLAHRPGLRPVFVGAAAAATLGIVVLWRRDPLTTGEVLGGAVLLRLAFLPLWPELSDDTFRYVWDGWLQADGINPYRHKPTDPALEPYQETPLFGRLNSADYYSVYPPLSQLVFGLGGTLFDGSLWGTYYAIKGAFAAVEVGGLVLLSRLTSARGLLLYAWNPLVVVETAGQGHTEAAAVALVIAAVWAVRQGRGHLASIAIAGAGLVKLYPFLLAPLLLRRFGANVVASGTAVVAAASAPYAASYVIPHVLDSVNLYFQLFEFNAGPYYAVKEAFRLATGEDWSKAIGPAFRTAYLTAVPVLYVIDALRGWSFRRAALWTTGLFFVFSTTVHPWYLVTVLPLAVLTDRSRGRPAWGWLWLGGASIGTYLFYVGGAYWPWIVLGWGGAAGLAIWQCRDSLRNFPGFLAEMADLTLQHFQRRRARAKAERIREPLVRALRRARATPGGDALSTETRSSRPAPAKVLDLGAGEGYVGETIQQRFPATVELADVVDMNRTALPHRTYDGRELPYRDDAFDVTVLYFVLHHCRHPDEVLEEALRVSRHGVIAVETVYHGEMQRRILRQLDRWANRLRSAGAMRAQESHLAFRTRAQWEDSVNRLATTVCWSRNVGGWGHPQYAWWATKTSKYAVIAQQDFGTSE